MSDRQDAEIARLRRFLDREQATKAARSSVTSFRQGPASRGSAEPSSGATRKRHLNLLTNKGLENLDEARSAVKSLIRRGGGSDDDWADAMQGLLGAFDGALALAKSNGEDLAASRRRVRELEDQLGDRAVKERQRSEAATLVESGGVSIIAAQEKSALAKVTADGNEYEVRRRGKDWRCSCDVFGDCVHVRAVQLCAYPCAPKAASSRAGAAIAASGAVTVKLWALEKGLVEVVDGYETFKVTRDGIAGGRCNCGAPNAECAHGRAVRAVTARL